MKNDWYTFLVCIGHLELFFLMPISQIVLFYPGIRGLIIEIFSNTDASGMM